MPLLDHLESLPTVVFPGEMHLFLLLVMAVVSSVVSAATPQISQPQLTTKQPFSNSNLENQNQQNTESAVIEEKVLLSEFRDLRLNCTCPPPSSAVSWSKDGSPLDIGDNQSNNSNLEADSKKSQQQPVSSLKIITTNPRLSQLLIEKANSTDIGDYECRQETSGTLLHHFSVRGKPRVKFNFSSPYVLSQTVTLGSPWAVNCEFAAALYSLNASIALLRCGPAEPKVKRGLGPTDSSPAALWCGRPSLGALQAETSAWVAASGGRVAIRQQSTLFTSFSSAFLQPEEFEFPPASTGGGQLANSTALSLSLRWARFEDVGYYLCAAENSLALSEAVVLLRVVDRYEAIWPAALLLGLALYLFSLVVVFESRRYLATNFLKLDEADSGGGSNNKLGG